MSLLMDALRRAEEAKRLAGASGQPAAAASPGELRLDPLETPENPSARSLPPLSRHLDSVDADLAAEAVDPPHRRGPARSAPAAVEAGAGESAERLAARNLFAVKQAPRSRLALWLFLGCAGLAILAIGAYFWWQLQAIASGSLVAMPAPAPQATQPRAQPLPLPVAPFPLAAAPPTVAPPSTAPGTPPAPPAARVPAPPPGAERPRRPAATGMAAGEDAGIFRPANHRQKHDQTLNHAYEAWQAGRLDEARRGYEQVLRGDPRNTDAQLGLATIAARQGQFERAQQLYLRVLESDPGDVTAQAALINLHGNGDGGQSESRLKTLLASQPDAPAVHFALGNLYARQRRWSEAQQAYFQAYALDPDNADYLFNVAVSLDHLRQSKLAAQYYRMALSVPEGGRAVFDRHAAAQRILELQP